MTTPNTSASATTAAAAATSSSATTTPAAGATSAVQSQSSPASNGDWTAGITNQEVRGWVQNKQYKDVETALEAHRNAEKLLGLPAERVIKLPENRDDAEAMGEVYKRLGRPEKPEEYALKVPEGGSSELSDWAAKSFHELGLSQKQGQALYDKWNANTAVMAEAANQAMQAKLQAEETALKREWGAAFDKNSRIAAKGALKFGIDAAAMDKIESAIGYQGVMKLFQKFGEATGEDGFVETGSGNGFGAMTPEAASSRKSVLMSDQMWVNRYLSGDIAAGTELERIEKMIAAGRT